jgi:serine/threonine-protein kinase
MANPRTNRKALQPGQRLDGRYELLYPYAQGGMATVWLARVQGKHGFEKLFAVKTILPHLAADEAFRNMFLDEARIASRIRHPHVAAIEDLGEDDGHLYMVLEWVQGDSWSKLFAAVIEGGDAIPADLMLRIAANACAGLHAAHVLTDDAGQALNVVHRDVSPQNVMISEAGVVKVIDFGVAKAVGRASEQTRTGLIKGKLEYLAPELALAKEVDRRADVWAVGATLYQMFAGHAPYTGKNDLEVLRRITAGKPPAPLPASVPPRVADVILRALHPDRSERVSTAADFQRLLESVMSFAVTPEDLAQALRHYLKPRIKARHQAIADSLAEAARRAETAHGAAPGQSDLSGGRPSFPTMPPEAAPLRSQSSVLVPSLAADLGDAKAREVVAELAPAPVSARAAPLRPLHAVWIAVATFITIGVWSTVVALALHSGDEAPTRAPDGPAAGHGGHHAGL